MNLNLKSRIERVMGVMPANAFDAPVSVEKGDPVDCGKFHRIPLRIRCHRTVVTAWWLRPKRPRGTGVLALHPTIACGKDDVVGLSGRENRSYGSELAERGHTVIAPDYPGYGDRREDPYSLGFASATMMGIVNHCATVTVLLSLPEVRCPRVGSIGHSLGGHNAIFHAIFDSRVGAVVSSCGFSTFSSYRGGDLAGWATRDYMPRIASEFHNDPSKVPFDFPELLAAILPRGLCVSAPISDSCFDHEGARQSVAFARRACEAQGIPGELLLALYPGCGHDFPRDTRETTYAFLENLINVP